MAVCRYCRPRWTKEPAAGGGPARLSFLGCPLGGAWNEIRDQPECSVAMLVCSWNACNWWSREHGYPPSKCHLLPLVPPSWLLWEGGCVWLIRLPAVFLTAPSGVSVLISTHQAGNSRGSKIHFDRRDDAAVWGETSARDSVLVGHCFYWRN